MGEKRKSKCVGFWFLMMVVGLLPLQRIYSQENSPHELSVKTLSRLVLENNFDIKLSESAQEEKKGNLMASEGSFDTNINYSLTKNEKDTPTATSLDGAGNAKAVETDDLTHSLSIKKVFKFGTEVTVPYTYKIADSSSSIKKIRKSYEPTLEFKLKQPLLKTFKPSYFTKDLQLDELSLKEGEQAHLEKMSKTLMETIELFYQVIEATSKISIKNGAVYVGKINYEFSQEKAKLGKASAIDVLDAESTYKKALEELQSEEVSKQNKEDELRIKIFGSTSPTLPTLSPTLNFQYQLEEIVPYKDLGVGEEHFQEFYTAALSKRVEKKSQEISLEKAKLQRDYSKIDLLPAVDVEYDVTYRGLNRDFKSSHKEMRERDFPSWKAGVTLSQPLMRYASRGAELMNEYKLKQQEIKNFQKEREISFELQKAMRDLKSNWMRIEALTVSLKAEEEKMKMIELNYKFGKVSHYDFNKNLQSKLQVQVDKLQAEMAYRKGVYSFYKARGILLEKVLDNPPLRVNQ